MNLGGLRQVPQRTWISVVRTVLYGGVAIVFATSHTEAVELVDGAILGAVLADYTTWVVRSVMQLPAHLLHGSYDALVNLLFGWFLFRATDFRIGDDGTAIAAAFFTFMLVLGIKIGYYAIQSVREGLGED